MKPFVQDLLLLVPSSPGHLNVWFVMLTTLVVALVGLARALSPTSLGEWRERVARGQSKTVVVEDSDDELSQALSSPEASSSLDDDSW